MTPDRELLPFLRRLGMLGLVILLLLAFGTVGFVATESVSVWHGFVQTLDTVATVGSVPQPEKTGGRVLKVGLELLGIGTLFYGLATVAEFFVSGQLSGMLEERRIQRMINSYNDHFIICGYGRVGRQVARDLNTAGARYVVIDNNPELREHAQDVGVRFIVGEPADDDVLRQAGIDRARGVIACVDSDADNIFITLTARELCPSIEIVARASEEDSERKLKRAGADRVVSPYKASGIEMARLALHPGVSGIVDVAPEYRMEEIEVGAGCRGTGEKIGDVRGGAIIVAVRHPDGTFEAQPAAETVLNQGDVIMAMGTLRTMARLEDLLATDGTRAS
jgi:voltage-gated potassium channel